MAKQSPIRIDATSHLDDALKALSQVPKEENGRISWDSGELEEGTFEIIYSLKFKPSVDDHIKDGAVWFVLNECARAKDFSRKFFIRKIREYIQKHLSKSPKTCVAVGQINCGPNVGLPNKLPSVFGQIEFRRSLSKSDQAVVNKLPEREKARLGLQSDFVIVISKTKATDERSGLEMAYRNMQFCFGVLNMIASGYGVSKRFGIPNAPIGKILSGSSIFTIDRRKRETGGYIWENTFPLLFKSSFSVLHAMDQKAIKKFVKFYVSDVRRTDFSEKLIQAVVLFQEGLATVDIDTALLKFWTGIELLCAKETKEPTEKIIERASSIFTNPKYAIMRLNFIQEFRNNIVHRGYASGHSVLCAQLGSLYLAKIIGFFLFNNYKFRKHSEILEYLSTPIDRQKLVAMMAHYRKRLKALKVKAT
jgi:hypothetical protein